MGYLPIYSIFIDMIDEPLLYHFQGMLRWTAKPLNVESVRSFFETEDAETIFNKPIDVIQGIYNLAISDEKIEEQGMIRLSKTGEMKWSKLNSESIVHWAEANKKLKKYMEKLYQENTVNMYEKYLCEGKLKICINPLFSSACHYKLWYRYKPVPAFFI